MLSPVTKNRMEWSNKVLGAVSFNTLAVLVLGILARVVPRGAYSLDPSKL
jgi:hypothetical protein